MCVHSYNDGPLFPPPSFSKFPLHGQDCSGKDATMEIKESYRSSASFYVFVGVTAFLFTLFAVAVYVVMEPMYTLHEWMPLLVRNGFSKSYEVSVFLLNEWLLFAVMWNTNV